MQKFSFTIDLEDSSETYSTKGRHIDMSDRILALCDQHDVLATFFTVGKLARVAPNLIKRIASKGHEIAYHSHAHVTLDQESPGRFKQETATDKAYIEDLTGRPLLGYRAPGFSLTPKSLWVTEVLAETGFLYSSSIMPTCLSRFGFPEAKTTPFFWPSGLLELPLPMATLGKAHIPYSGGIYLYSWPLFLTELFVRYADPQQILWTYFHPQDFDVEERFTRLPNTPAWMSLLLWIRREVAQKRVTHLMSKYEHGEQLGSIATRLVQEATRR